MEASSIVSRARTAFHSAAAKAERVFEDIKKSDSLTDQDSEEESPKTSNPDSPNKAPESKSHHEVNYLTKWDWRERLKNIRVGKKGVEDFEKAGNSAMAFAIFDENLYLKPMGEVSESKGSEIGSPSEGLSNIGIIPPASVMKQLAIAVEAGKGFKSMSDLLASPRGSSPVTGRAFSAVKSLILHEKEEKFAAEFGGNEKVLSLITSLLNADREFPGSKIDLDSDTTTNTSSLPKDIHGAPLQSFVVKLSEVIGSFKTLWKMTIFWYKVVAELRRLWSEGLYVPGIPPDEIPDLNSCLLYQKLQVINSCISRKRRHSIATESLESVIGQASSNVEESAVSGGTIPVLYARIGTGELVLRRGADKQSDNLTMLETGEPIYIPVMQEGPLLTEDLIKETEELVLQTGSVGVGCSHLLSDMQAFKAANPGCILEDFVRWHSPPDWTETDTISKFENTPNDGNPLSARGQLSSRMQKEGNLWRELWEAAKAVPAVKQTPLFDVDLIVEGILNDLEDIPPSELFEQLFVSLLGSGFVIAEEKLSTNSSLSKLFYECKDYVIATCQGSFWTDKVDDICQVYETVEMMLLKPEEAQKMVKQPDDATTGGESKRVFRKLGLMFGSDGRHLDVNLGDKNHNREFIRRRQSFSSIFSKKTLRPDSPSPAEKPSCVVEMIR